MANSFKERLHKGYAQSMELAAKPIVEEKSQFQRIRIFDSVANGRVMTLDGHRPDHHRATRAPTQKCLRICRSSSTAGSSG